ncbi:MAG: hypothetical protein H7831_13650 [Magnetococcus sp. WYHC-3]
MTTLCTEELASAPSIDPLERAILDRFQRDFPLTPRPYAEMAHVLGCSEDEVLGALARLQAVGVIGRIGATYRTGAAGASTLAAMAVPATCLEAVATLVSSFPEVNHNYAREHHFNLWFVVTAADAVIVQRVLEAIARHTGLDIMSLPMEQAFHLDLGFALPWK